jgi:ATP-dependent 26S proteasome regulatory subunit
MSNPSGKFTLKKITKFSSLKEDDKLELPESDLCFQDGDSIYQFSYIKSEEEAKYEVKPGVFIMLETPGGLRLSKMELRERNLLESAVSTARILKEAELFFSKLDVYERLGRPKKRGVLLYSKPGMGKSSAVEKFCSKAIAEEPGTVVMTWPTSAISADDVSSFLSISSEYTKECKRLILIIEDIGGGERDGNRGRSEVDSGLLNLLDGVGMVFKIPTFIIATTNHPENLLESLANRPGRFDLMMKLAPPSHKEKIELMGFICKRGLSPDEIDCLGKKGTEDFSIAHLEEIAIRAELHDKTYMQVVDELIEHSNVFKRDFEDRSKNVGISAFN